MEAAFETLLSALQPKPALFLAAREMLRDLWDQRLAGAKQRGSEAKAQIARIEHKTEQIMERIFQADSHMLITAYETQIRKLEEQKVALAEKVKTAARPLQTFDEAFQTACAFLANPCKLWLSDCLDDKRLVLKLAFAGKLPYDRKEGFRTVNPALPFKALADFGNPDYDLVEPMGFSFSGPKSLLNQPLNHCDHD